MDTRSLIVTQHELRQDLNAMKKWVLDGGRWGNIQISRFEDGLLYIHDGHHRTAATFLAGRSLLYPEEYRITDWTYKDYLDINFDAHWVTPYDPRTECRLPDIASFKDHVLGILDREEAIEYIKTHKHLYAESRKFNGVHQLVGVLHPDGYKEFGKAITRLSHDELKEIINETH